MKRVGIIRGGEGKNYNSSLKKGGEIISYISENLADKFKVLDILIDKAGVWHLSGVPILPADLIHKVDIVWNIAHPSIAIILDSFSIPNVGQGSFSGALENSREMLKEHMAKINMPMPRCVVIPVYQKDFDPRYAEGSGEASGPRERYSIKKAKDIHEKFASPWIVKSFTEEANMGIHLAKTFNELVAAIEDGVEHKKSILVEEFITGKVGSVHAVSGFRNEDIYTFPLGNTFGNFSIDEKEKLAKLAKDLHKHINAGHYLKSDFVLNPRGKVYLLQIESMPDLNPNSHFSQVCESVGAKMHHVIEHMLKK